jgi:hypothetical protein
MRRPLLEAFAKKLSKEDVVVVEATDNAASVAAVIAPHVKRVVIANPKQVRIIAHAKINEVASRKVGFSPATCDPGLDVLAAVVDDRAQPPSG